MNLLNSFNEGLKSLMQNKQRSFLTVLGIIIGVASVIAMLAVGQGAQKSITADLNKLGSNQITFQAGNYSDGKYYEEAITMGDIKAIEDANFSSIRVVAPVVSTQEKIIGSGNSQSVMINGITSGYMISENIKLAEGQGITKEHVENSDLVAVLGPEIAEKLFKTKTNIVGRTVRIKSQVYTIVGVTEMRGESLYFDMDTLVMIPISTAQIRLVRSNPTDKIDYFTIKTVDSTMMDKAIQGVSSVLRSRHLSTLGVDDFEVINMQNIIQSANNITKILTGVIGGIASVSLLVGGIGIMNIMLVSVVERTMEIGLRKALGARKKHIISQFLIESILLSLAGGVVGILVGWLLSIGISKILTIISKTPFTSSISVFSIVLATSFSAFIGIIFGIYPANQAANLEPVEALRSN